MGTTTGVGIIFYILRSSLHESAALPQVADSTSLVLLVSCCYTTTALPDLAGEWPGVASVCGMIRRQATVGSVGMLLVIRGGDMVRHSVQVH